ALDREVLLQATDAQDRLAVAGGAAVRVLDGGGAHARSPSVVLRWVLMTVPVSVPGPVTGSVWSGGGASPAVASPAAAPSAASTGRASPASTASVAVSLNTSA